MTIKSNPRIAYPEILEGDTIRAEWTSGETRYTAQGVVHQKVDDSYGGFIRDASSAIIGPHSTSVPDYWLVDRVHILEGSEYGDSFEYTAAVQNIKVVVTYFREDGWVKEFTIGSKKHSTILSDKEARAAFDKNNGRLVK